MRVSQRTGHRVAERLRLLLAVAIRSLATGVKFHLAHAAFAACQTEWNDDASADFESLVLAANLDDLAHTLMTKDISALHLRDKSAHQVEVRAADRTRGHFNDRV